MKSTRRHKKRQDESSGKKPTRAAQEHAVCQPGQSTISNPDTNPKKQTIFTGLLKPSQGRPPLSARDKLFLSRNIRRKPADLSIFCRSPFEKAAVAALAATAVSSGRDLILPQGDEAKRFVCRCFYVPVWSTIEIGWFSKGEATIPLWLFEPAIYLNALERVHLEMVLSRTQNPPNQFKGFEWEKPLNPGQFGGLPKPTIDWFIDPPEGYAHWNGRFDAYYDACFKSFKYWMRLKCKDSYELTQKLGDAAIMGTIEHLTPFPANLIGSVLENLRKSHTKALAAFYKNAYKPIAAPVSADPALDTWLFEAWPLVVQNGWRYPQILALAKRRFSQRTDKPLTRPDQIEARAERLELHFGPGVSKGGAPPATARIQSPFQPIPLLAVFIQGFAELENKWLLGQRGLATSK